MEIMEYDKSKKETYDAAKNNRKRKVSSKVTLIVFFLLLFLSLYFISLYQLNLESYLNHQNNYDKQTGDIDDILRYGKDTKNENEEWMSDLLERSIKSMETCSELTKTSTNTEAILQRVTNATLLPENGIINDLSRSISSNYDQRCTLPPNKSCNETGWSVIFMAHESSGPRPNKMINYMKDLTKLKETREIILVWNGDNNQSPPHQLLQWDKDDTHPLRIFYHNFGNNLMNRWHPDLLPKMNALLYFDDDGPFLSHAAILAGFELWKRNSDVPIGSWGRNFRFKNQDTRMTNEMQRQIQTSTNMIQQGLQAKHHPSFIPICRSNGDLLEYNFNDFPQFGAHFFLPSGTFLHKNFLCFIFHPIFQRLRDFVTEHLTHPDDITIFSIIAQVTGKSPKALIRNIDPPVNNKHLISPLNSGEPGDQIFTINTNRRRLLWKKYQNWGEMRTEAINSISSYFGNIHPGSVGWCVGTPYFLNRSRVARGIPIKETCTSEHVKWEDVPWVNKDGLGYDQC